MAKRLLPIVLAGLAARAQTSTPAFEVATIKPAIPLGLLGMKYTRTGGPGSGDPSLYTCRNCTLALLVWEAFGLPDYGMSSPEWLQSVRFDVSAKLPDGTSKDAFQRMMQNLLAERFKLAVHREKKELPAYQLLVAKNGPKFKEARPKDAAPEDDATFAKLKKDDDGYPILPPGATMAVAAGYARLRSESQPIAWFANMLSGQLQRPVIDATGLSGTYDFVLSWVMEQRNAAAPETSGPTLIAALQSQLGLRLEQRKALVEILVVDHIEKVPTEN